MKALGGFLPGTTGSKDKPVALDVATTGEDVPKPPKSVTLTSPKKIMAGIVKAVAPGEAAFKATESNATKPRRSTATGKTRFGMTMGAAATEMQRRFRGHICRKSEINLSTKLHLGYELRILELRKAKRAQGRGFVKTLSWLMLLITVFVLQHGRTVQMRYTLVEALKNQVLDTAYFDEGGHEHIDFDQIRNIDHMWDWTSEFFGAVSGGAGERVYLSTYNQIVGAVRLETMRVTDQSCPYKNSSWSTGVLKDARPLLYDSSKDDNCYGTLGDGRQTDPFGPWFDTNKWEPNTGHGQVRYTYDFPADPTFASLSLNELRSHEFVSKNTRDFTIAMTIYNNALPMLLFFRLSFSISPTGEFKQIFKIEAMNVLEYMEPWFWGQASLEIIACLWTVQKIFKYLRRIYRSVKKFGLYRGLINYFSDVTILLDWSILIMVIVWFSQWVWLLLDNSRDIDLDTKRYVDLEDAAHHFHTYNTLFNAILCVSLMQLVKYTGLDDRMALLTRSVYRSVSDLVPFMLLFLIFVLVFAVIGHLMYGPTLEAWSTAGKAIVTAVDIMNGNYLFVELEEGIIGGTTGDYAVAIFFF